MTPALLLVKRLACALGFGSRLIEFCDACECATDLVWWAADELWIAIVGAYGGVRCTRCFDRACYARGMLLRWRPEVAHVRGEDGRWP